MFASRNNNQAKEPKGRRPERDDSTPDRKTSSEENPIWQSLAMRSGILQTKLTIGQADDPYEREADRVADLVMRMPAPQSDGRGLSITPLTSRQAQRKCSECEEEEGKLQRKESGGADAPATAPPIVHETLNSPGQPLDAATRAYFEPRFGRSFADVRLHTGEEANAATREVSASAFTVGNQMAFAAGQYTPHSKTGRRLLAHELTHVAQQERLGHGSEKMLLQRQPIEEDKACIEPPSVDIATVDLPSLECVSDLRGATVWTMRLWDFELDKDTLSPCHKAALDLLVSDANDIVASTPDILGWSVTWIVGHASPEGEEYYNEGLALRRAEAVFSELGAVVSEALPVPESSGKRCGEGAPRDNYPYFRAVDVTMEFFGESPVPLHALDPRANEDLQNPEEAVGQTPQAPSNAATPVVYSLTFDDGPHAASLGTGKNYTENVLDTLASRGAKAGFFIQSGVAHRGANPIGRALVARMAKEGHTVGVHTGGSIDHEAHPSAEAAGRLESELESGKKHISKETGSVPKFVRPPYGKYDENVEATYNRTGLTMLKWDIDGDEGAGSFEDLKSNFNWGMRWLGPWNWEGNTPVGPKIVILYHDIRKITADNIGGMIDYITDYTKSYKKTAKFEAP